MPSKNGPIIKDIADFSGVSTATVDRVMNRRSGVHQLTAKKVLHAAVSLGYILEEDMLDSLRPRPMKVIFLLPAGTNPYLRLLGDTIKSATDKLTGRNIRARCFFIDSFNPRLLSESLGYYGKRADGVAFMAIDHPEVREAVSDLRAKGKHVVTIVSDVASDSRIAYVGLDNRAVGRTAAYLLGRFARVTSGHVALITASRTYRAHEEREMGFLGMMEKGFPQYRVIAAREGHDDRDENYYHTVRLLKEYYDLVGIYNVGGSSDGIARALQDSGRDKDVIFIGHGLTKDTRACLVNEIMDVVITQSPKQIVQTVFNIFENIRSEKAANDNVAQLNMEIVTRENLPDESL